MAIVPAGAEAWPRGHPAAAHVQSVLANGGGAELRRSDSGRAGPNGLDPGGHGGHHKRYNGNLNQVRSAVSPARSWHMQSAAPSKP